MLRAHVRIRRLIDAPIVRPSHLPGAEGANINGPCLVAAPPWLPNPLGRYYLYFAHHHGRYIRLAFADDVQGPWRLHQDGSLRLSDARACRGHIASPDVVVDPEAGELRMYFHGFERGGKAQRTFLARSSDGLAFEVGGPALGPSYIRVFRHAGAWFAICAGGRLLRSQDGATPFEAGAGLLPGARPRHFAVHRAGEGELHVYFTCKGDAPERILRSRMDLRGDWRGWCLSEPEEVLRPERAWEGVDLPLAPSRPGAAPGPEHALRDPHVFQDADGCVYLTYAVAGESGIGVAEIRES